MNAHREPVSFNALYPKARQGLWQGHALPRPFGYIGHRWTNQGRTGRSLPPGQPRLSRGRRGARANSFRCRKSANTVNTTVKA